MLRPKVRKKRKLLICLDGKIENIMKKHYLHLMRKEDIIDMYRFGKWQQVALSSTGFDGKLDDKNTIALVKKMFDKAAPFEYSNEYYFVHVFSQKKGSFEIKDVEDIIPMDSESYGMGLKLSPEIRLSEAFFEDCYHEFQINCEIRNSVEGIKNIFNIFNITRQKYTKVCGIIDENNLRSLLSDIYYDCPISEDKSLWYYLSRYYRHNSYPNDTRGDFLDAIHAFFNYEKKREMDYSVSESVIGKEIISQNSNIKYYELIKVIESNEKFFNHCEGVEKDYCRVAPLFLKLKRVFYDGIKPDKTYCGMEIEKFIKSTGNYNQNDFIRALYLLGIVLGRNNTYQYLYFKQGHPILKNKE